MRRFIDATGIPFWTTPKAAASCRREPSQSFTGRALDEAFREADVVLVIGAHANSMLTFLLPPRFSAEAKFINVNIDGKEIDGNRGVDLGVIGDAKLVLQQLTAAAASRLPSRTEETPGSPGCQPSSNPTRSATPHCCIPTKVPIHPLRLCKEVRDIITRHHPGGGQPPG